MLEQHPFGGGGINNTTKKELEKMGLSVSWANPNYSLTHEKSIVIDGEELFILTQNLTTSAFSKNREYDVLDTNPEDVSIVRQIFLNDWNRSNYSPPSSNLLISPINSRARIENLIKDGASKIDIEIEEIVDEKIIALVCEKEKSSEVRLIIPPIKNLSANKKASDTLTKCGASVRFLSSPYPHAKLILVDNDKAYIGSINLSKQSMDENRELGIILVESNSIVTLYSTFEKDWKKASKE